MGLHRTLGNVSLDFLVHSDICSFKHQSYILCNKKILHRLNLTNKIFYDQFELMITERNISGQCDVIIH